MKRRYTDTWNFYIDFYFYTLWWWEPTFPWLRKKSNTNDHSKFSSSHRQSNQLEGYSGARSSFWVLETMARYLPCLLISEPFWEVVLGTKWSAQVIDPKEENMKLLNKRLRWQMDNSDRGLRFIPLDITSLRLIVFTDASFANNIDLTSQIGYVICLADASNKANIIHWSSTKCKRVRRSVLASELYAMAQGFDAGVVIRSTVGKVLQIPALPMILCTDSKSLYDCLVRLESTQEKRRKHDTSNAVQWNTGGWPGGITLGNWCSAKHKPYADHNRYTDRMVDLISLTSQILLGRKL